MRRSFGRWPARQHLWRTCQWSRASQLDFRNAAVLVLLLVLPIYSGCATDGAPRGDAAGKAPQAVLKADDLLIVDCLLPGQIRQLGTSQTYVTARRAVKTSARDCAIRGGEYVAFDRASYATALKIWLPLAEKGDVEAQSYVGEIYEKGLGVPPDPAKAAEWYRRAADKGYARASINLGSLYERGEGVPEDPNQALSQYRRAAGPNGPPFKIVLPGRDESEQMRKEIAELRKQLAEKQTQLERSQRELENLRRSLEQRRGEVEGERRTLTQLRKDLENERANAQSSTPSRIRDLEKSIAEREARLEAKDREIGGLRAQLTRLESDSAAQRDQMAVLRKQTADAGQPSANTGPEIELIEPELTVATRDIQPTRVPVPTTDRVALATSDRVTVIGRVHAPRGVASLTVNGSDARVVSANVFKTQIDVKQPQERVRIVAVDRGGHKATFDFVIRRSERTAAQPDRDDRVGIPRPRQRMNFGNYHALVIGINDYKYVRPLRTAVNDAKEVARVLEKDYGFRVTLLLNSTHYELLSALNDMRQRLTEKDNLLIYYAGHGELDQRNQRGHWLPIDAEPNNPARWISNVAITDILNAMTVQQLLVVADSCYAGTLTRSALGRLEGGISEEEQIRLMQIMAQKRSRMVMTSGGVEPVIDDVGASHSVFALSFIALLRANAGVLAGQEMFQLLRFRVTARADRVDMRQVPEYAPIKFAGHESGDFLFVRR